MKIAVRGWKDKKSQSFFVWEINKLENLPSDIEGDIDFFHPGYERRVGGKPTKGDGKKGEAPDQYELDDDELSDVDKATISLLSERVSVSFKKPYITNRIPNRKKAVNNVIGEGDREVLDKSLSPNEKEEAGSLPSGAWNNLDDVTDDVHLYLGKFQSFMEMVDSLVDNYDCDLINKDIVKLPKVGNGKKHLLTDSHNPRCLAIVELSRENKLFSLLEVDTSDGAVKLSTMLLASEFDWLEENEKIILHKIMKKSLGWPGNFFKNQLGEGAYAGIPHPKSKHSGVLPKEVIDPWAQRIANWIRRSS